jgi:hypothetical protein
VATSAQPIGVIARQLELSERRIQQCSRDDVNPRAEHDHTTSWAAAGTAAETETD